ncbi:DUF4167 domain-containing protein [Phenylobacterium sp.]|uniref:DUF4167 domain-containing protein n=1 Tax=Phenylobacterium sp. TaxID=1871053 RepID=UPI0025DB0A32|nr:DUF4167 domain-containing protein [Phenylobacterium sp.]
MRDFKGMKRQRGRNRGGGSGGGGGGGGNTKPTQNANRAFDSNGPEGVKVRGNAQHVFEKYQQLARDANAAGDRVLGENYLQHAEHYFRLLRAIQPNRPASEILGRDQFASGYDIDFEDESGQPQGEPYDPNAIENGGDGRQDGGDRGQWQRDDRPRDERQRDDRPRDDRPRDERPRDERPRDERPRDDRPRDDRPRNNNTSNNSNNTSSNDRWRERDNRDRNRNDRPRDDRPRDDRPRDDQPRAEQARADQPRADQLRAEQPRAESAEPRRERYDRQDRGDRPDRAERQDRDPLAVVQPQGDPPSLERGPMLRDSEGGASHAPAFLQARPAPAAPPAADAGEEKPKPRRRRAPRTFEAGEGAPPAESEDA